MHRLPNSFLIASIPPLPDDAKTFYKSIYEPYENAIVAGYKAAAENRAAEYKADQQLKISNPSLYYYKYPKEQPGYYPDSYYQQANSAANSSAGNNIKPYNDGTTTCSSCNGHGYTEYDCGQGGGHPCRKYCSACNGTGRIGR